MDLVRIAVGQDADLDVVMEGGVGAEAGNVGSGAGAVDNVGIEAVNLERI